MEKIIKRPEDFAELLGSHKDKPFSNGFVYNIFLQCKKNATEAAKRLIEQSQRNDCKASSVTLALLRVNDKIQGFRRNINFSWNNIVSFLNEDFNFPVARSSIPNTQPKTPPTFLSPIKTRIDKDCYSCDKRKSCNKELFTANKKLKLAVKTVKTEKAEISKTFQVKRVNQMIKRKTNSISKYQLKTQKLDAEISSLRKSLKLINIKCQGLIKEKKRLIKTNMKLESAVLALEKKLKTQDMMLKDKDMDIDRLTCQIEEVERGPALIKDSKCFNVRIRSVIYRCLECNVPVDAISKVMMSCATLSNVTLTSQDLPNTSTIAQMSREMGVIAVLQVAETLLNADAVTLAFDATTIKGSHINQIHFATKEHILTASITELPGGKADDYVQHVTETIEDISVTHSAMHKLDIAEVRHQIVGKLMSTLTDRASVNHAAIAKLNNILEKELLELHCHLHPLDGIASETRKALLQLNDDIPSSTFGSDCRAANLLYSISKLRYKAKGDPSGFKSFLKQNGLPCSTFPRYVGNRLHILFCSAGIVYRYKELIVNYLEKYCNNTTSLRTSLLKDLKNETILIHLQVLGLWGKFLTGPWMALFYAGENQRNHLEMAEYLKSAIDVIKRINAEPEFLLTSSLDAFGRPLIQDETLAALIIVEGKYIDQLLLVIKTVANATITVLSRQLSRYLTGDIARPSDSVKAKAASAPVNNIWAERTLGIIDFMARRAPNAEMTFLDGKAKVKVNRSLDWLFNKPRNEQDTIVKFCISRGAASRKLGKERKLRGEEIVKLRLKEKGQKRDMEKRNKLAKDIKKLILDNSLLINDPIFHSLSDYIKTKLVDLLHVDPVKIEGTRIEHLWNEGGNDVMYNGKIIMKLLPSAGKVVSFRIAYWKQDEEEDDAEDVRISLDSLLADVVLGDFIFY